MAKSLIVEEGFATVTEAARYLRLCPATLYKLMESQELAYAKFGKARRIPWKAIREFAERSLVAG